MPEPRYTTERCVPGPPYIISDDMGLAQRICRNISMPLVLKERIRTGGMGSIFLAQDEASNRYALKINSIIDRMMFRHELLAQEIGAERGVAPPVHEAGIDATTKASYILMDYIDGNEFSRIVHDGFDIFSLHYRTTKLIEIANGLSTLHENGVFHGDVKPNNVLISNDRIHIIDFGVSRVEDLEYERDPRVIYGTPAYIAPEMFTGETCNDKTDQFSLGLLMYQAVTRTGPNDWCPSDDARDRDLWDPRELNEGCTDQLAEAINRTLSYDPEERYDSCYDLASELESALEGL